jgi:hypothetical protein
MPTAKLHDHVDGLRVTVSARTVPGIRARHLKVSLQDVDHIFEVREASQHFSFNFSSATSRQRPLQIQFEVLDLADDAGVAFSSDIVGLIVESFQITPGGAA